MANKNDKNLNLKITMLGGRRTGKTSALAAMMGNFEQNFRNTDITITVGDIKTMDALDKKRREMIEYCAAASRNEDFFPDGSPTQGTPTYKFDVGLKGKNKDKIELEFFDYPGEFLDEGDNHISILEERISESDVLMIVIDTPYLMEDDGCYNEARNRCFRITEIIKRNLDVETTRPKMILIVPLKCEKYYDNGRMQEVHERIKQDDCYGNLIHYFNSDKSVCEIAIVPILTIGTAIFTRFERDENYDYIMIDSNGVKMPKNPMYHFTDKARAAAIKHNRNQQQYDSDPQYCEQPLAYILYYALELAMKAREDRRLIYYDIFSSIIESISKAILKYIQTRFLNFASAEDFLIQRDKIKEVMIRDGNGFGIILNPLHM